MAQQRPSPAGASGFQLLDKPLATPPRRLIIAVDGIEKQGKTHFALTAPGPIGILNFDIGLEGVVEKFQAEGKQIHVAGNVGRGSGRHYEIPKPGGKDQDELKSAAEAANIIWAQRMADYRHALDKFRTLIIDTATEDWDLLRLARFGKLTQVMPQHYTTVNAEYRRMIREAFDQSTCNVILLHKRKAEYVNTVNAAGKEVSNRTGNTVRAGFNDIGYLVQMNATAFRDGDGFQLAIHDCRQNMSLADTVVPEAMLNFPMVAQMVFPDSDESSWV